jgi:glutamate dehydrogenase/leucine dehydrogenase
MIIFRVPWVNDKGELLQQRIRVQFNSAIGLTKAACASIRP